MRGFDRLRVVTAAAFAGEIRAAELNAAVGFGGHVLSDVVLPGVWRACPRRRSC